MCFRPEYYKHQGQTKCDLGVLEFELQMTFSFLTAAMGEAQLWIETGWECILVMSDFLTNPGLNLLATEGEICRHKNGIHRFFFQWLTKAPPPPASISH